MARNDDAHMATVRLTLELLAEHSSLIMRLARSRAAGTLKDEAAIALLSEAAWNTVKRLSAIEGLPSDQVGVIPPGEQP